MKSISDVVSGAGLAGYAEVALMIFFLVFVAIGLRVLLSAKSSFAREAQLPLDDAAPGNRGQNPNSEGKGSLTPISSHSRHTREEQ